MFVKNTRTVFANSLKKQKERPEFENFTET